MSLSTMPTMLTHHAIPQEQIQPPMKGATRVAKYITLFDGEEKENPEILIILV